MRKLILFIITGVLFGINIKAQIDLNNGLVASYSFNGNANDETENKINGTVNGASLTTDRFDQLGSAYNFDGINDYIIMPADKLPTSERTVSLWFYLNSISKGPTPFAYGGGGVGSSWFMCINHSETPKSFHLEAHWNRHQLDFYYTNEPINAWYHWVITTSSTGTKMYLNGNLVASNTDFISNTGVLGKFLGIGVCCSGGGAVPYTDSNVGYFNGKIDDIRIYNRAINEQEVQFLYGITGIKDLVNSNISIYPNPAQNILHFTNISDEATIYIYDMNGKLIVKSMIKDKQTDISTLPSGIYTVKVNDQNEVLRTKVVKF
jgi:hypothetical protein